MRPHIFVTADPVDGHRSVEDIRRNIRSGHAKRLWEAQRVLADAELGQKPYEPGDRFPGRDEMSARHANRDYTIVHRAGTRALRAALACLLTDDLRYRDDALAQMDVLFDTDRWPEWRDEAHKGMRIDLRAGQLSRSLSIAYDWLYPYLDADQRRSIVDGIDRCGIRPYLADVADGVGWANGTNNWMTCVVGGHGIAGLALGADHPDSDALVDYAHPRLNGYFDQYGPEGEFNESVSYANAHALPILYFSAYRSAHPAAPNRMAEFPIPDTCRWMMYFTVPPGHVVPFGDSHIGRPPSAPMFATVADAARDPVLQWFYLEHSRPDDPDTDPWELLWYDPDLEPEAPSLPLGRAYHGHSQNISVRSGWDPRSETCVVYGKGGHGAERHGNHDAGQVCIDSNGHRLITDPGSPPGYPADFFGPNRYEYYNASVTGHNVLTFDGREMRREEADAATIVASEFQDGRGGWWTVDLTPLYDDVDTVRRTVVYLSPHTVVVHDTAQTPTPADVSLRWHIAVTPDWSPDGAFSVVNGDGALDARILAPAGPGLDVSLERHAYAAPYNRFRLGDVFEQQHEPYLDARLTTDTLSLLTLFQVRPPAGTPSPWSETADGWTNGDLSVTLTSDALRVADPESQWEVPV